MRTLNAVVDELAVKHPTGLFVRQLADSEDLSSWHDITWLQLARAVNAMAVWLNSNLGPSTEDEIVAYLGVSDPRYLIFILAAMKTGYKPLLASPRNSLEGQLSLLKTLGCSKFVFTSEFEQQRMSICAQVPHLRCVQMCTLATYLLPQAQRSTDYAEPKDVAPTDTALVLHSSGTTGLPKPVHITVGAIAVIEKVKEMPAPEGRQHMHDYLYTSDTTLSMMPFFHIMGIMLLSRAIYHRGPIILFPIGKPVTADLFTRAIEHTKPMSIVCVPSILEDISSQENGLHILSTLKDIFYGGAPLAKACGDIINEITNLHPGLGSTEIFSATQLLPAESCNWDYFEWSPASGIVMEQVNDGSGYSEMVFRRLPNSEFQYVFQNFPTLSEWRTKDLFESHPTKPRLWRYTGRIDDIIVLNNGEKINPVSFEKAIEGHAWVKGALVVGMGQFQAGLMIEPQQEYFSLSSEALIEQLWPTIDAANVNLPGHAKIWRSMVMMTSPDKPFKRTPKNSIYRKHTYALYENEISAIYEQISVGVDVNILELADATNLSAICNVVRSAFSSALMRYSNAVSDETDIFRLGTDSLQVLQLSKVLTQALNKFTLPSVPPRLIYNNSNVIRLAKALERAIADGAFPVDDAGSTSREEKMAASVALHTAGLQPSSGAAAKILQQDSQTMVLTGSTGSLGSYILANLLSQSTVGYVYCLNRSSDAKSRQIRMFSERGLDTSLLNSRVDFLTTDFSKEFFGLSEYQYTELSNSASAFIHNAWSVNFSSSLEAFESTHIAGTRRVVDFAATSAQKCHVVFVSSIASVGNWSSVHGNEPVSETFSPDHRLPLNQGYGESKHVASCILAEASKTCGVVSTIIRVGQLSGPVTGPGVWNKQEWIPSLISTSKSLGQIPESLGIQDALDWVPVDLAADAIVELTTANVQSNNDEPLNCYNLVNPQEGQWSTLVAAIQKFYQPPTHAEATAHRDVTTRDSLYVSAISNSNIGRSTSASSLYSNASSIGSNNDSRSHSSKGTSTNDTDIDEEGHVLKPTTSTIVPTTAIAAVPLTEWIISLKSVDSTKVDIEKNYPALKLVDFFEALASEAFPMPSNNPEDKEEAGKKVRVRLETKKTAQVSPTVRNLEAITPALMTKWLDSWQF